MSADIVRVLDLAVRDLCREGDYGWEPEGDSIALLRALHDAVIEERKAFRAFTAAMAGPPRHIRVRARARAKWEDARDALLALCREVPA